MVKKYFKNFFIVSIWFLAVLLLISQMFYTRFLQDDYFLLGYISNDSWLEFLKAVWKSQGGNLWIYGFQGLLLKSSLYSVNTLLISVWTLATISTVTFANYLILKWFLGRDIHALGKYKILSIFAVSYLGFEGLFTPGLIAAFSYHQAAFSHLWPVTLLIIALILLITNRRNLVLAFGLGIFIGNANISESFTAIVVLVLIILFRKRNSLIENVFIRADIKFFYALFCGTFAGFFVILVAPGFWNRAQNSVGLPSSGQDFFNRFLKSFSSFTADLITHPMIFLAFLIGLMVAIPKKYGQDKILIISKIKLLASLGFILFGSLIIGSTFAYVSWHQSTGLYQVFIPLTFILGIYSKSIINVDLEKFQYFFIVFILASLILISLRAGLSFKARASDWDDAFKVNYCLIKNDPKAKLVGADMLYPGFNLGIEDVSEWEWMRNGYANWVSNPNFKSNIDCIPD